jgi:hypothetical protein
VGLGVREKEKENEEVGINQNGERHETWNQCFPPRGAWTVCESRSLVKAGNLHDKEIIYPH